MGISADDFNQILTDLGVVVVYRAFNGTQDFYGGSAYAFSADTSKTWIVFKHSSKNALEKWGIVDLADFYVIMPTTDTLNYRDRIVYNSEIFEYTPDCVSVTRSANGVALYKYFTMKKVGES